jgi:hypothetical protein
MRKRSFRSSEPNAPLYPSRSASARRLLAALGAAVALGGTLASCAGEAAPPDLVDAGDPRDKDLAGGALLPDAGFAEPDAGAPSADAGRL